MTVIYFINLIATIFVIYLVHVGNDNYQIFIQLNQKNIYHSFYRFSMPSYDEILISGICVCNNNCNIPNRFIAEFMYSREYNEFHIFCKFN